MKPLLLLPALALLIGCASYSSNQRFTNHFAPDPWLQGLAQNLTTPQQIGPQAALAAFLPIARHNDESFRDRILDRAVNDGTDEYVESLLIGMGVASLGYAGWESWEGDGNQSLEVLLEATLVSQGLTSLIKRTRKRTRPRPGSTSQFSFPSAHASLAFGTATFLARRIEDNSEGWVSALGYLLYIPAGYIGYSRIDSDKHWTSDIMAGGLIGTTITNVIYNAHYGRPESGEGGIFGQGRTAIIPIVEEGKAGLALQYRF